MNLAQLIDTLRADEQFMSCVTHWRTQEARPARYAPYPAHVDARIRAVLRRRAPGQVSDSVSSGDLALDAGTYRVTFQGQPLKVGPAEFKLLHFFMKHSERVHSRSQLLDQVWGDHVFIEERTVDVHVKRLREALGEHAAAMIETVRGAGYRITTQGIAAPVVSAAA